jgi:hypothetical protein
MSGTIQLPTTGTLTGVQLVEGINTALAEMTIDFRSDTAPTAAGLGVDSLAGIKWRDSSATPEVLKVRNQADDAWIIAGYYDEASDVFYPASALRASNNLSDLGNAGTARTNLGLGTAAVETVEAIRLIPQNSKSAAYTTVLSDGGKHILHPSADTTARTFTIDSNANVPYPLGTAITFVNQASAGVLTIAITSDTMRLAGAGTTGSRTLAANGTATALKITTTEWIISGVGLT